MQKQIQAQAEQAIRELIATANPTKGDFVVVGCSSSEIAGGKIGTAGSPEIAEMVFQGIYPVLQEKGLFLAAQCCEHLNRALIIEAEAAEQYRLDIVNVTPQPKAGGSFAATVWAQMRSPVAVESIRAVCGLDIGGTLIGMHLKQVAVPVRLSLTKIGEAPLIAARTRPKFIGGERAIYNPQLL